MIIRLRSALICLLCAIAAGAALASHTGFADAKAEACGLPAGGAIYHARSYSLRDDCKQAAPLILQADINRDPTGRGLLIQGNGHIIDATGIVGGNNASGAPFASCQAGVPLTIVNATIRADGFAGLVGCDARLMNVRFVSEGGGKEQAQGGTGASGVAPTKYEPIPVGVFAKIFRWQIEDDLLMRIWGVDPHTSQGFHLLTLTQSDIDAARGGGMVATSADCSAQVNVDANEVVTVSVGPNATGLILNVKFDDGIRGHVISTWTSDEATLCPAEETAQWRELQYCVLVTGDYVNLRDSPDGATILNILSPGRELPALARLADWFQVNVFGQVGWLSPDHLLQIGDCG